MPCAQQRPQPRLGIAALGLCALLSACGQVPGGGFSFAAPGGTGTPSRLTKVRLNGAEVVLAAPRGYCFDRKMLRRDAADGFALLPRCDLLGGPGFFGSRNAGVITATLGELPTKGRAPSVSDLAASTPGTHIVTRREDGPLPLVKLDMPGHSAAGASPEHWRGAMVLDGHVIVLALYAPAKSPLLTERGAELLTQMAELTREASRPPPAPTAEAAKATLPPRRTASGALRPLARPDARASHAGAPEGDSGGKLSLRKRISGLFD
ncbi:hypothetical protein PXK58_15570 [Phaeobacter gallaeciensis]|uniref:hypothetical protein n=1 Tax=Phaeobacter gallaeciensis TaxID=60890 RepID=UPI00237FE229|nr:hypothetical protein [Phaeobacter gallaeciensis]MDE4275810.1 hypothetical protein [Phaeobacter gallaeciensis]MDE4300977.1 hypothetical protein [Phaeobacter gallaeciensis]MDE5186141.1 hypothetical protein [Phaeobacter gallaeciensis]MEC9312500.1 hypothetical protein [Pseudomonadota bacterium]